MRNAGLELGAGASRPAARQGACLGPAAVPRLALERPGSVLRVWDRRWPRLVLQCLEKACVRSALPWKVMVSGGVMASIGWYRLLLGVSISTLSICCRDVCIKLMEGYVSLVSIN